MVRAVSRTHRTYREEEVRGAVTDLFFTWGSTFRHGSHHWVVTVLYVRFLPKTWGKVISIPDMFF